MHNFLHLHTSKGSFMDSLIKIPELIDYCVLNKHSHCAITDHGNMAGIVDFYNETSKKGIVPILGCELYMANTSRTITKFTKDDPDRTPSHLVLLAKNKQGYNNLCKIMTESNKYIYNSRPRADDDLLFKYKEGLIAMSACKGGYIPAKLNSNMNKLAEAKATQYKEWFGDDFYFELMSHEDEEQEEINSKLITLAKKLKIECVMTNDSHYMYPSEEQIHRISLRIKYNRKLSDDEKKGPPRFDGTGFHLKEAYEYPEKYQPYVDTDKITNKIEKYSIYDNDGKYFMPTVEKSKDLLREKCEHALKLNNIDDEEHRNRFEYEYKVITDLNYADYFLIVADAVNWCKNNGILVGPSRGSAGGCLIAHLLGIVLFDPINKDCPLYFERFLNPDRVSPPDIDIDITNRDKVIDYLKSKYGSDKVVNIGAINTLALRASLKEVARVLDYSKEIQPLLDLIPDDTIGLTNKELYDKNPEYKSLIDSNIKFRAIYNAATHLEGLYKNLTIHASGVIISSESLNLPLFASKDKHTKEYSVYSTYYDMHNIEYLGYVKFDFLGLKTLKIIEGTLNKINSSGNPFTISDIDYFTTDSKTMKLINDKKTTCIFQWESEGYKALIGRLHPDTFNELIDLNTLYRPGPMESGLTDSYINRKFGREKVEVEEALKPFLKRQGLPLFQEEIMKLCQVIAGFTLAQADIIRKAIGKKIPELMAQQKEKFIAGCISVSGYTEEKANSTWEMLEKFQRYSWNLSHGLAYTIISYWTAYLRAHFPAEFFAANLDENVSSPDRMSIILREAKSDGVGVMPPDINISKLDHVVSDGNIIMTLGSIKGVGAKTVESILRIREYHTFKDLNDFCTIVPKKDCNASAKESLVFAGAFDKFYNNDMLKRIDQAKEVIINKDKLQQVEAYQKTDVIRLEKDKLGFYINETPITADRLRIFDIHFIILSISDIHYHIDKKGNKMAFLTVTNFEEDFSMTLFASLYAKHQKIVKKNNVLMFCVDTLKADNNNNRGFVVKELYPVLVDGQRASSFFDSVCPVVSYEDNLIRNLTYDRYVYINDGFHDVFVFQQTGIKYVPLDTIEEFIMGFKLYKGMG